MSVSPERIGSLAYEALIFEARLSPKPGLVDAEGSGAHADMDLSLLLKSAEAIQPYFLRFALRGANDCALPPEGRLSAIRQDGLDAESAMFAATSGINTHKGAIFLLGVLCYAAGRRSASSTALAAEEIARDAALICRGVTRELGVSAGRAFTRYGAKGARGEAEAGYPGVTQIALPAHESALKSGASETDAWLIALLRLIEHLEDANVLARCGETVALELRQAARAIADAYPAGGEALLAELRALGEQCRLWHASPGGAADLLACAKFLYSLSSETRIQQETI
ncbi:MAG TPA: triphosphoribosyl-dephospho-CoA synthase [Feifaniaceae bacterium]|nr:triphosphoribosyl-dephospho-CoA synthase [Feifaniaceae bacterium]